jgi:tetratricopeptide (TPR) repeat protein
MAAGEVLVLADAGQHDDAGGAGGSGGTGKTQLALAAATELLQARTVDFLVWVGAASRDSVLTGYAQAVADLNIADVGHNIESAAPMMLEWLANTSRSWLVVLDDLADPTDMDGLWPQSAARRIMVTARSADVVPPGQAARISLIGPLNEREAVNYLTVALKDDPDLRLGAPDLAENLDCLPIGLAFATAVMTDRRLDCRDYSALLAERRQRLAGGWGGACPLAVMAAWSLAVDRASELIPADLAWPILVLAAMLDPDGIPAAVLMSEPACDYLVGRAGAALAGRQAQIRSAVSVLARLGLLNVDVASATHTVRMHAQLQQAVRSYVAADYRDHAGRAAADALMQAWQAAPPSAMLAQALRDCTARLRETTGGLLWDSGCHPVLLQAGASLDDTGLTRSAVAYWQFMASASAEFLGSEHPDARIASSMLASSYERAGQPASAIGIYERALADSEEAHGPGHDDSLASLTKLAGAYMAVGRTGDAVALYERNLASRERAQGPRHLDTIAARASLADCYRSAGQLKEAIAVYERALSDREHAQGSRHLDTIGARASLAFAYRTAGRMRDAIPAYERTLADREMVQGYHHPDTLTARGNLANAYHAARRVKDAIGVFERVLADSEQVLGPHHPQTLTASGNLASAYHSARRLADAIPLYERTIADSEVVLGRTHPDTLTLLSNLGHAYHTVGRLTDAIAVFQRTLDESGQVLGPDHPLTKAARENLRVVSQG